MAEFQIRKDDLTKTRIVDTGNSPADFDLAGDEILVKVDRFAFTANNVTYGVAGDQIGYWQFFPPHAPKANEAADQDDISGWGILPVWGFADVVVSDVEGVAVGERLYGYFPPAHFLKIKPINIKPHQLTDGAAHRSALPPTYNSYQRVNAEPGYDKSGDDARSILWPLHVTSFCLWDAMQDKDFYGAKQVIVTSASSKTSIGLGHALHQDDTAPHSIGLTSSGNLEFVKGLGLYDSCLKYDDLASIDASVPTVIVDMAGNPNLLGALHSHLGDNMKFCSNVGLTHWEEVADREGAASGINRDRSEFFFAPGHIQKRAKDWGPQGFAEKSGSFLQGSIKQSKAWLQVEYLPGLDGLDSVFAKVANGGAAPDKGLMVVM